MSTTRRTTSGEYGDVVKMLADFGLISKEFKLADDITIEERHRVWRFPRIRFVQFEEKDEDWCRAIGWGREDDAVVKLKATGYLEGFEETHRNDRRGEPISVTATYRILSVERPPRCAF